MLKKIIAVSDSVNDSLYKYWFNVYVPNPQIFAISYEDRTKGLNRNLTHISYRGLKVLFQKLMIHMNKLGEICLESKRTRSPSNDKKECISSVIILENVHSGIKKFDVRSFLREKYLLTFIDGTLRMYLF